MSRPRFLIDENLSVHLPALAQARGYEAMHVNHRGLREWSDWSLLAMIEAEDWVLVTNTPASVAASGKSETARALSKTKLYT